MKDKLRGVFIFENGLEIVRSLFKRYDRKKGNFVFKLIIFISLLATSQLGLGQNGGDRTGNGHNRLIPSPSDFNMETCYSEVPLKVREFCDYLAKDLYDFQRDIIFNANKEAKRFYYECCWE